MAEWIASLPDYFAVDQLRTFGVREIVLLLVLAIVVYMLVMVLRIKGLSARRGLDELAAARYESDLAASGRPERGNKAREPSLSAPLPAGKEKLDVYYEAPRSEPKNKYFEPPDAPADEVPGRIAERSSERVVASFDQEKLLRLERELASTREELDALRAAFAETRSALGAEIERLKAGQRVSPTYGDSLRMAMAGASAEEIAASCGISRAEADLVLSLARGGAAGGRPGEPAPAPEGEDGMNRRSRYGSY